MLEEKYFNLTGTNPCDLISNCEFGKKVDELTQKRLIAYLGGDRGDDKIAYERYQVSGGAVLEIRDSGGTPHLKIRANPDLRERSLPIIKDLLLNHELKEIN